MSKSLPAREIYVVDVPEPINLTVEFVYNFFVPTEGKSETGGIEEKYLKRPAGELGSEFIDYASTRVPRFNVLKWVLPKITNRSSKTNETSISPGLITNNLKKIVTENDLSSLDYFSVLLDDPDIDEKIFNFVSASALQQVYDKGDNDDTSLYKTAVRVGTGLPAHVDTEFLKTGLNQQKKAAGVQFFDEQGKVLQNNRLNDLKSVNVLTQLNSKLAQRMIAKSIADPHSPYGEELENLLDVTGRLTSYIKQKSFSCNCSICSSPCW
jgi:hypothetical protein